MGKEDAKGSYLSLSEDGVRAHSVRHYSQKTASALPDAGAGVQGVCLWPLKQRLRSPSS